MKRWILVLALLLSFGLNLGVFGTLVFKRAQARRSAPWIEGQGGPRLERVADRLALAGEVRSRFIETQRRFMVEVGRGARLMAEERRELREELGSRRPDRDRVAQLVRSTGQRAIDLDLLFTDNVLFVRETLDGPGEQRYIRFLAQMYTRERAGVAPTQRRRGRRR